MDSLLIDKYNLDKELVEQAQHYYEISEKYAESVSMRDAAYENIKNTDAEVYFELRQKFDNEGVKVTESMLSQNTLIHPRHIAAHSEHNELKLTSDKLLALKDAFNQRTYMLRDLVQLYATGYFTDSSVRATNTTAEDIAYSNIRKNIKVVDDDIVGRKLKQKKLNRTIVNQ